MKSQATFNTRISARRLTTASVVRTARRSRRACWTIVTLTAVLPLLMTAATQAGDPDDYYVELTEVRSIDGTGNSTGGAANTPLLRKWPGTYPDDGSGATMLEWPDRENPRTISNAVVHQAQVRVNTRRNSDYLWAWGQFLDHDLDLTDGHAGNGTGDIPIVDSGDVLAPGPIFFNRSNYSPATGTPGIPREQMNEITAFIDASNVYGSDEVRADALRTFSGGKLKISDEGLLPFNVDGLPNAGGTSPTLFLAGDVRANENIMLSSLHTLFVREHNRLAALIALLDPVAADEEIYQLARKIVGCEMQIITYTEFLPALLGPAAPNLEYCGYDPAVDASIMNEFSTALYRFGHSLLSARLKMDGAGLPVERIPLRDAFFNPSVLTSSPNKVDRLLIGATLQLCMDVDTFIVDDVRNFLFGSPGAGGLDLATLNIQRGRDHGLPDYNTLRQAYGLPAVNDFSDITSRTYVQGKLAEVYASVDEIDAWVGGLAENHIPGAIVGELLATGLSEQFYRLLQGDRMSFLNDPDINSYLVKAVIDLPRLSLDDVIRPNTLSQLMTDNVFSVDGIVNSHVVATYDPEYNRIYVSGNRGHNHVVFVETPFGMLIHGLGSTTINGSGVAVIPCGLNPHITVDLGDGNDRVYTVMCDLGNMTISFGKGNDILATYFSSADSQYVDGGEGSDYFVKPYISVPAEKKRILSVP